MKEQQVSLDELSERAAMLCEVLGVDPLAYPLGGVDLRNVDIVAGWFLDMQDRAKRTDGSPHT